MAKGLLTCIAGPTASGKSRLAVMLAEQMGGVVVNADSMQVYAGIPIITAQPTIEEQGGVTHELYGFRDLAEVFSADAWAKMAAKTIQEHLSRGRNVFVVGGSGLYFRALLDGLAGFPVIDDEVRSEARADVHRLGPEQAHAYISGIDQEILASVKNTDPQRIARAWEVYLQTGKPMSHFQQRQKTALPEGMNYRGLYLKPDRAWLHERIDARLQLMLNNGALEEVKWVGGLQLDPDVPALKACGIPELRAHLDGKISLDEARDLMLFSTRQFAKRQYTWFNRNMIAWRCISEQYYYQNNNIRDIFMQIAPLTIGAKGE